MPTRQEEVSATQIPEFTIADRLRKARERTGLDLRGFADEIDSTKSTISNYESNRYSATRKRIVLKAWALRSGVPLEWLETGKVDLTQPTPPPAWVTGDDSGVTNVLHLTSPDVDVRYEAA